MKRDPLYHKILERLAKPLDADVFESCAQDLLRQDYPTLSPVHGGNDAGFDGAVGTAEGRFPLICTTGTRVLSNVKRSLGEYLARNPGPARAIVATSQALTPPQQRTIIKAAEVLGIAIVNIHERRDFANRLYRNSRWRKELLGLTGDAPALSRLPSRGRFDTAALLVGRTRELAKVESSTGDLLVVGQPGSGKTYLHQHWAEHDGCFFVATEDLGRIADEVRDRDPACLVVDDAHTKIKLVEDLRRLRVETEARFHIHANCWPNHENECRAIMEVSDDSIIRLGLLTRDQIVEVIKAHGVFGSERLLNLLLDQAEGKPGLAAVLSEACKRGDVGRVWTGEALAQHLLSGRRVAASANDRAVLAAFALGGDAGMSIDAVGQGLDMSSADVQGTVVGLGAGGVIEELDDEHLAVHPESVRALLARDVFFSGPTSLKPQALLAGVRVPADAARVLMGAKQRGGRVTVEQIDALVRESNRPDDWQHYGYVDPRCAQHILDHYPDRVALAAPGLLRHTAERAIPRLLDIAASGQGPRENDTAHPLHRLAEWMVGSDPSDPGHLQRRATLLRAVKQWSTESVAPLPNILGRALATALAPNFADTSEVAGNGLKVMFRRGVFSLAHLREVAFLWPTARDILAAAPPAALKPVLETIRMWCFPQGLAGSTGIGPEVAEFLRASGVTMLRDTVGLPSAGRATKSCAARLSRRGRLGVDVAVDPDFETLFGERSIEEDFEASRTRRDLELRQFADRLAGLPPDQAFGMLSAAEDDARAAGMGRGGWDRITVYHHLATQVADPGWWADKLVEGGLAENFVAPFLARVVAADRRGGVERLTRLLANPSYTLTAVQLALGLDPPEESVTGEAVRILAAGTFADALWLPHTAMPMVTRRRLLEHPDRTVAASAAIAEWYREPHGQIDESLRPLWRSAIVSPSDEDDYAIKEILAADGTLAAEWVTAHLERDNPTFAWDASAVLISTAGILPRDVRRRLLGKLTARSFNGRLFDALVGDDMDLFAEWLSSTSDRRLRALPFRRTPSARWISLAMVALDNGVTADALASMAFPVDGAWSIEGDDVYAEWLKEYESVLAHPDPRLHTATERGRAWVRDAVARERQQEQLIEVYGFDALRRRRRPPCVPLACD